MAELAGFLIDANNVKTYILGPIDGMNIGIRCLHDPLTLLRGYEFLRMAKPMTASPFHLREYEQVVIN